MSYAICAVGNGFSVEDRKTGKRVSYHHTWSAATKAYNRLVRQTRRSANARKAT